MVQTPVVLLSRRRYNRYPDEKGTERWQVIRDARERQESYNRYPDEKGTESCRTESWHVHLSRVTTVTPMKRGLKVRRDRTRHGVVVCYNRYPDEKGTERLLPVPDGLHCVSYDRYPDEKGTESASPTMGSANSKLQPLPR